MGFGILPARIMHVIGGDQRDVQFGADPHKQLVHFSLLRDAMIL